MTIKDSPIEEMLKGTSRSTLRVRKAVFLCLMAALLTASIFVILQLLHHSAIATLLFILCMIGAVYVLMQEKSRHDLAHAERVLQEAQEAIRQARLQAEITGRSRMEFLANMSHDLRTPLNAVIGFSEILKKEVMGPLGAPVYKDYAQNIYDSGHSLLKIISEILEVSKIEMGNRELTASNFKLKNTLNACMTILSNRFEEAGVSLQILIPDSLPEILGEQLGIKQVMLNLLSNALKATASGGKVEVKAWVDPACGEMIIDVVDTGVGMTAEEIQRVLQPFGKIDNSFSSVQSGSGLGLTIVDSLIRLHGGTFGFISEKGVGTTARITLPAFRVLQ